MDFCIRKLNNFTSVITKGTTPSNVGETFTDEGVMYFRSELVGRTKYVDKSKGLLFISHETHQKLKRSQLKSGDLLFSMAGAYLGKLSLVAADDVPANTNQAVAIIRFIPDSCNIEYVYYYMLQGWYNEYICSFNAQAAQPNINLEQIGNLKLNMPNKKTQDKIASILSTYDSLIEVNNKRIKLLEQMAEELYKEWFVRFRFPGYENAEFVDGLPKDWEYTEFSKVFSFDRGVSYSSEEIECDVGENLINLKNIQGYGGFRRDGTKKYNGKYKSEQIVGYKDLIMGVTDMTQDRRTVGSVALIPSLSGVISADLIKLNSNISSIFLYCLFRYGAYSKYISQFGNGANVIHLKPSSIKNVKLLIPKTSIIRLFDEKIEPVIDQIDILNQKNDNLIKQRDLLLPRLMSGKLEV